jgi:hypothetical protein
MSRITGESLVKREQRGHMIGRRNRSGRDWKQ